MTEDDLKKNKKEADNSENCDDEYDYDTDKNRIIVKKSILT